MKCQFACAICGRKGTEGWLSGAVTEIFVCDECLRTRNTVEILELFEDV